jgi:hypothetical protein
MINASKLLSKTEIVLFLNKCDILAAKLRAGVRFKDYAHVYDGPNTVDGVTRCESFPLVIDCNARCGNNMTDSRNPISRSSAPQVPRDTEEPFFQGGLQILTYLSAPWLGVDCDWQERMFYCHLTAVTDPNSTQKILNSSTFSWWALSVWCISHPHPIVQEIVIRAQLTGSSLL